jgi:hypothetical protein
MSAPLKTKAEAPLADGTTFTKEADIEYRKFSDM